MAIRSKKGRNYWVEIERNHHYGVVVQVTVMLSMSHIKTTGEFNLSMIDVGREIETWLTYVGPIAP
jgi:hypothetical protein